MTTAAILVIGNEILSGKIRDENSPWLAERLRAAGVDLKRILVLPDEESLLAQHIAELSGRFDHVFTSGGIGPTHDDCTMAAVASAFQMKLHHHEALINALHDRIAPADRDTSRFRAMKRMCLTPEGAVLWHSPELYFPLVVVQNVVIYPVCRNSFEKKSPPLLTVSPVSLYKLDGSSRTILRRTLPMSWRPFRKTGRR